VSYDLDIRPDALVDIEKAAGWYEKQEQGLGVDFARTSAATTVSRRTHEVVLPPLTGVARVARGWLNVSRRRSMTRINWRMF
jgi:hypothetical protein